MAELSRKNHPVSEGMKNLTLRQGVQSIVDHRKAMTENKKQLLFFYRVEAAALQTQKRSGTKTVSLKCTTQILHTGKAALRKYLPEHDQKAALLNEIRKSRNKPRISENSATCRI